MDAAFVLRLTSQVTDPVWDELWIEIIAEGLEAISIESEVLDSVSAELGPRIDVWLWSHVTAPVIQDAVHPVDPWLEEPR